ncbi:POTRA domain, FtsQ-type family protein [Streptococcus oralis]|mgnify:FL=1|jgi:cell division protein divIB|uniref:cell division protein FtsQ/DivIB n=1 Tax=Streptococcus TaxID=1301 RepID=UPI00066DD7A8|nr:MULTISPECIES: FtsQ-type POTRA domain-containing protein [Streptococcus]MCP9038108.1 FtsQ-type POTRA domain-containing protein [Streptococcus oralis]MCP9052697.1 FtsQ-type POTRA domain-containing protein [Streptococcus oralis]MCP9057728.1 FtsQ-type POTRA domain-containing protein [Streptococcus oralis]MCP9066070.1 FtsQ-type POTRA domain-containing protein [Streptococcus oralis]MCP9070389.1 FtsQ-type POTRA domain-containing protein [Streptococcus oralis]
MSKDKKKESNQKQELSEWQKRNQEYLKKKAEEEAALAEEKEKEKQARKEANSKLLEESKKSSSESDEEASSPSKELSEKEEKSQKDDRKVKEGKEKKKKEKPEKPAKPKIAPVHIWRAVSILVPSVLVLLLSVYLLTPLSTIKNIEVKGNSNTQADDIKQASGIQDSDYTLALLLDKETYAERIKSNHWIESAKINYQFPTNFTIEVKEFDIVGYYVSGEEYYPILSSGTVESTPVDRLNLPETYLTVTFNDEQQVKKLITGLSTISEDIKSQIQKIELAPSKATADLLKITMLDTDEILVPLSELSKKLPYYSKIKPQLSEPSVVDMEAGAYSYTIADKLIEEAEEKAKQEAKEAEKKKQEEEKKKQEEQGNQSQTSQQSQSR